MLAMKKVTKDEIKKLANLSRIKLDDEEAESLRSELEKILGYVDQLSQVDTEGIEPTSQVTGLVNQMRPDEEEDYGTTREDLLKNTPDQKDGYIKVRKVL